jgi:hypothetical protein
MNYTLCDYAGIDYGGPFGQANRNLDTGIRYGCIPANSVCPEALDDILRNGTNASFESYKEEVINGVKAVLEHKVGKSALAEIAELVDDSLGEFYEEQEDEHGFIDGEYQVILSGTDLTVIRSPWVGRFQFCSPCAPGAVYLENPLSPDAGDPAENWGYCLGPEWFDEFNPMPYPEPMPLATFLELRPADGCKGIWPAEELKPVTN